MTPLDAAEIVALAERVERGEIKALSIKQPYPHHIFHDGKDVENRDWPTKGRGWVMVHAGKASDGPFACANGTKIRAAGVQAPDYEDAPPCRQHRPGYVCDDRLAAASQRIAARLVLGKTLACQPVGRSYTRVVARCRLPDGRDLSCALVAAGAADVWPVYWRRYRMGRCG